MAESPAQPPDGQDAAPRKARRGRGRPPKSKNRKTLERERKEELERERLAMIDAADRAATMAAQAETRGVKLAKDVLQDFMRLFAGMAATYQPLPPGAVAPEGKVVDEAKFERYATLAVDTASRLAPFESPKFSAVMIGATTINKVEVVGGMPDDFAAPASIPQAQLPAGTIVEAEEDYVPPAAAAG